MKKILSTILLLGVISVASAQHKGGEDLFATVKKFVSLGEHRTGTKVDFATSQWLKTELDKIGFRTEFVNFPVNQFFFEGGNIVADNKNLDVLPLWPVDPKVNQSQKGILIDGDKTTDVSKLKGKLVLTKLPISGGALNEAIEKHLEKIIQAGAKGIMAITPSNTGEIVAHNTREDTKPWSIPVWQVASKDSTVFNDVIKSGTEVAVTIKGYSKPIQARNIVGKIGNGKQYVVISTPISGWYTCGGERGPGLATWLSLAEWVSKNRSQFTDYTFVFTGNSGHELDNLGALTFAEKAAPKPEETRLWIHLGAAIAVRGWKEENGFFIHTDEVDANRGIYYDESVANTFEKAFANIKARKGKGTEANKATIKAGGEGGLYKEKGYKNLVSLAYAHRYHHVKTDDENNTSPALLLEVSNALKTFISDELKH